MPHTRLVNYGLHQIGWFACVLGGAWHRPWTGFLIAVILLGAHLRLSVERSLEARLVVFATAVGALVEMGQIAAGTYRFTSGTVLDTHVTGLRSLLDALPGSTGCVIYVSSTGVYGQDAGEWVDEESVCEPLSEGGRACVSGEQLLIAHARGRDALVLRLAGLYGPGRVPRSADVIAGRPIAGSPDAYLNLIHMEDAPAAVVAAAASRPVTGRTHVVSDGHPPIRGEYAGWLATQLGVPRPVFEAGSGLGKRVRSARAVHELRLRLKYPSYREGLAAMRGRRDAIECSRPTDSGRRAQPPHHLRCQHPDTGLGRRRL